MQLNCVGQSNHPVRWFGWMAITVSTVVLLGWVLNDGSPAYQTLLLMKANTAIALFLAGVALIVMPSQDKVWARIVRIVCALGMVAIGLGTIMEGVLGVDFGVDQLLFLDNFTLPQLFPGRVSTNAAVCIFLLGILFLNCASPRTFKYFCSPIVLIVIFIASLSFVGFVYDVPLLYGQDQYLRMAPHSAVALVIICLGIISTNPKDGVFSIFFGNGLGETVARRVLPAACIILFLLGWLHLRAVQTSLFSSEFGTLLLVLANLACIATLILWSAHVIRRSEVERNKISEVIELLEQRFIAIMNNVAAVVFMKDASGRYIYINREFERRFHVKPDEVYGKTDYDMFEKKQADLFRKNDQEVLAGEEPREYEEEIIQDGVVHTFISIKFPMWDPVAKAYAMCGVATDITDRKKASLAILEAARIKTEFASMVSHELRTPLSVIKAAIEIVKDGMAGTVTMDQINHLAMATRNVDRLSRLITSVLDYQKLDSGDAGFKIVDCNINEVLGQVVEDFRPVMDQKGLKLVNQLQNNVCHVNCDRDSITQVVMNLLNNAVKFTDRGRIAVSTKKENEQVVVTVADEGIGISSEDIPKLFKSFSQISHAQHKSVGAGLGLAICRKIIEQHGGRIWVESQLGKGSQFHFSLPLASK